MAIEQLHTMTDYGGVGVVPLLDSIVVATGGYFFSITLFVMLFTLTGASYFTMLKFTGKKRFWNAITAVSFTTFLSSLIIASMNHDSIIYLNGYWVGFYTLLTVGSWFMLSNYKE